MIYLLFGVRFVTPNVTIEVREEKINFRRIGWFIDYFTGFHAMVTIPDLCFGFGFVVLIDCWEFAFSFEIVVLNTSDFWQMPFLMHSNCDGPINEFQTRFLQKKPKVQQIKCHFQTARNQIFVLCHGPQQRDEFDENCKGFGWPNMLSGLAKQQIWRLNQTTRKMDYWLWFAWF